jgi:hypothetical protein
MYDLTLCRKSAIVRQIRWKLENIKLKVDSSRYVSAKSMIDFYTSYCSGKGYLNQLAFKKLQAINKMTEDEFLDAL